MEPVAALASPPVVFVVLVVPGQGDRLLMGVLVPIASSSKEGAVGTCWHCTGSQRSMEELR